MKKAAKKLSDAQPLRLARTDPRQLSFFGQLHTEELLKGHKHMTNKSKPARTMALQPVADINGAFFGTLAGKKIVVCFHERKRAKVQDRFNSITLRTARIKAAQAIAKTESLPLFLGVQVRVGTRWDNGWLVSPELFRKFKQGASDFSLSEKAREAYVAAKAAVPGVRFTVTKAA